MTGVCVITAPVDENSYVEESDGIGLSIFSGGVVMFDKMLNKCSEKTLIFTMS